MAKFFKDRDSIESALVVAIIALVVGVVIGGVYANNRVHRTLEDSSALITSSCIIGDEGHGMVEYLECIDSNQVENNNVYIDKIDNAENSIQTALDALDSGDYDGAYSELNDYKPNN